MKLSGKIKRGSATIETALLMPFLLAVMLFIIYFSFYVYNREASSTIAYTAAIKGAQMEQEGRAYIEKEITGYVKEESKKLLFVRDLEYSVKVTTLKVEVSVSLTQKSPFQSMLRQIGAGDAFSCKVKKSASRLHPASIIWDMRRGIKGNQ